MRMKRPPYIFGTIEYYLSLSGIAAISVVLLIAYISSPGTLHERENTLYSRFLFVFYLTMFSAPYAVASFLAYCDSKGSRKTGGFNILTAFMIFIFGTYYIFGFAYLNPSLIATLLCVYLFFLPFFLFTVSILHGLHIYRENKRNAQKMAN